MNTLRTLAGMALLSSLAAPAFARDAHWYGQIGAWAYDLRGSVSDVSRLDFQDDLGLRPRDRGEFLLGYQPGSRDPRWLPGVELDYLRLSADGEQQLSGLALPGLGTPPLFGELPLLEGNTAQTTARIQALEARLDWPWQLGDLLLGAGLHLTRLDGRIVVADADTGASNRQPVDEIFPSLSLSASWQPLETLRFSLRGHYVQYRQDRAQGLEASAYWRLFGPIGLEAGWRQRVYKVSSDDYLIDARLSGARLGLRLELAR